LCTNAGVLLAAAAWRVIVSTDAFAQLKDDVFRATVDFSKGICPQVSANVIAVSIPRLHEQRGRNPCPDVEQASIHIRLRRVPFISLDLQ
jgi:hypothetical protein